MRTLLVQLGDSVMERRNVYSLAKEFVGRPTLPTEDCSPAKLITRKYPSSEEGVRYNSAPQAGLEPATLRLTAGCSTIELLWNEKCEDFYGQSDLLGDDRNRSAVMQIYEKTKLKSTICDSLTNLLVLPILLLAIALDTRSCIGAI